MKNILIVDTNFLINNTGNIKGIIEELTSKDIEVYVSEIVKEEFINIQLRKLEKTRKQINNLMDIFIWATSFDFYGNEIN